MSVIDARRSASRRATRPSGASSPTARHLRRLRAARDREVPTSTRKCSRRIDLAPRTSRRSVPVALGFDGRYLAQLGELAAPGVDASEPPSAQRGPTLRREVRREWPATAARIRRDANGRPDEVVGSRRHPSTRVHEGEAALRATNELASASPRKLCGMPLHGDGDRKLARVYRPLSQGFGHGVDFGSNRSRDPSWMSCWRNRHRRALLAATT